VVAQLERKAGKKANQVNQGGQDSEDSGEVH